MLSLSDLNNYTSLQVYTCYYCRAWNSCLASMTSFLLQGSHWKDHTTVEFTFTPGFGHVSDVAFAMCDNPTKVISTDNSPHDNFLFYVASMTFVNLAS